MVNAPAPFDPTAPAGFGPPSPHLPGTVLLRDGTPAFPYNGQYYPITWNGMTWAFASSAPVTPDRLPSGVPGAQPAPTQPPAAARNDATPGMDGTRSRAPVQGQDGIRSFSPMELSVRNGTTPEAQAFARSQPAAITINNPVTPNAPAPPMQGQAGAAVPGSTPALAQTPQPMPPQTQQDGTPNPTPMPPAPQSVSDAQLGQARSFSEWLGMLQNSGDAMQRQQGFSYSNQGLQGNAPPVQFAQTPGYTAGTQPPQPMPAAPPPSTSPPPQPGGVSTQPFYFATGGGVPPFPAAPAEGANDQQPNAVTGEGEDADGTYGGEVVIDPEAIRQGLVHYTEGPTETNLAPGTLIAPLPQHLDGLFRKELPPLSGTPAPDQNAPMPEFAAGGAYYGPDDTYGPHAAYGTPSTAPTGPLLYGVQQPAGQTNLEDAAWKSVGGRVGNPNGLPELRQYTQSQRKLLDQQNAANGSTVTTDDLEYLFRITGPGASRGGQYH